MKSPSPHSAKSAAKRSKKAAPPLNIGTIVVPVDFSPAGQPALEYAESLARLTGATICLVHVLRPIISEIDFATIQHDRNTRKEKVERELGSIQAERFSDIRSNFQIREGTPFEEIIKAADKVKADLIVMATHGYTGLRHIVLGSTTERVVRHATCPVIVVRSKLSKGKNPKNKSSSRR